MACLCGVAGGRIAFYFSTVLLVSFLPPWPFQGCGGACGLCPKSRARRMCALRLLRFILLGSFNDTLLVVSILDIVAGFEVLKGLLIVPVGTMGSF